MDLLAAASKHCVSLQQQWFCAALRTVLGLLAEAGAKSAYTDCAHAARRLQVSGASSASTAAIAETGGRSAQDTHLQAGSDRPADALQGQAIL